MSSHDFRPSLRRDLCLLAAAGVAAAVASVAPDRDWKSGARVASAILLGGAMARWAVRPLFIPLRDLYASAHQQGFEQGWQEGRVRDLPKVVQLNEYRLSDALLELDEAEKC